LYGRQHPLFIAYAIGCIFHTPVAVASNIQTILVCRFFGGLFSAAPLSIVGGALADFWDPVNRAVAVSVFAGATFAGPVAGPIIGGFVTKSHLGWRWTIWITLIMNSFSGLVSFLVIPETYASTLLQAKAKRLRQETNNPELYSKFDESNLGWRILAQKYMLRPFVIISQEPILMLFTAYLSLVYGILYGFLEAYPISFQVVRGWDQGVGALPFIGILIGIIAGSTCISVITKTRFARKYKRHGRVIPEERLPSMIIGAVILPIGLFWFAWTSSPHISWIPQVLAGAPIGMGIIMVFLPGLNYLVDVRNISFGPLIPM
jgi:DHA1 family multidrug resistance protein-like MFS transporter